MAHLRRAGGCEDRGRRGRTAFTAKARHDRGCDGLARLQQLRPHVGTPSRRKRAFRSAKARSSERSDKDHPDYRGELARQDKGLWTSRSNKRGVLAARAPSSSCTPKGAWRSRRP
eukprot:6193655-Pleurochrysis_carterae.AAC.1